MNNKKIASKIHLLLKKRNPTEHQKLLFYSRFRARQRYIDNVFERFGIIFIRLLRNKIKIAKRKYCT